MNGPPPVHGSESLFAHRRRLLLGLTFVGLRLTGVLLLTAWALGLLLTDRMAWSQWIWWIPTEAAIFGALLIALPYTLARPIRSHARRCLPLAITLLWWMTIDHRPFRSVPEDPPGMSIVHWTVGVTLPDQGESVARRIVELDPDLAVLTDAGVTIAHPLLREWLGDEGRPRRTGNFTVLTRHEVRRFRLLAQGDGITLALLSLWVPSMGAEPITILLIDLPSDPTLPRRDVITRLEQFMEMAEVPETDLIIGDWNITRGSFSMRRAFPDARHAFRRAGRGIGASFPAPWPFLHIDHMLMRGEFDCTRYELLRPPLGRHFIQRGWFIRAPRFGATTTDD